MFQLHSTEQFCWEKFAVMGRLLLWKGGGGNFCESDLNWSSFAVESSPIGPTHEYWGAFIFCGKRGIFRKSSLLTILGCNIFSIRSNPWVSRRRRSNCSTLENSFILFYPNLISRLYYPNRGFLNLEDQKLCFDPVKF